jgi:hypothetical protein
MNLLKVRREKNKTNSVKADYAYDLLHGVMVHVLEVVADFPEVRNLSPAGLGGARPAHAVTFAQTTHRFAYSLKQKCVQISQNDNK